jgi:glycerol-3-phosphate acyltransferase PlsX
LGDRLIIALDAMGGDDAPGIVIDGANLALTRFPQVDFLLFGPEPVLAPLLQRAPKLQGRARIVHTDVVISGDAKPSLALRNGRQSSMRLAINAVHDGQAAGVVSAGNTGALMAMALGAHPARDRPPGDLLLLPERGGSGVRLGANIGCDAGNLFSCGDGRGLRARCRAGAADGRPANVGAGPAATGAARRRPRTRDAQCRSPSGFIGATTSPPARST